MEETKRERALTCIICPRGCELKITLDSDGKVLSVTGNACPRGAGYAESECTGPMRTVTSTVRCARGGVIPVKTSTHVPKALVMAVMREINSVVAPDRVAIGQIIIKDVCGTGADIVATASNEA